MSGLLKTLLDRAPPLYPSDYAFREIYLLASAAAKEASAVDGCLGWLEGWISRFEKARLAGTGRGSLHPRIIYAGFPWLAPAFSRPPQRFPQAGPAWSKMRKAQAAWHLTAWPAPDMLSRLIRHIGHVCASHKNGRLAVGFPRNLSGRSASQ